jgi:hypothetical protein
MIRAMAMATKRVIATNGNTTGNGYRCPSSSAVVVVVAGKDDKGGGGLFVLYGVVAKKIGLCVFSILIFGKETVCPDSLFLPAKFLESGFYFNSLGVTVAHTEPIYF